MNTNDFNDLDIPSLVDATRVCTRQDEWGYFDFDIEDNAFTPEAIAALLNDVMTLPEIAEGLGFQYDTLIKAAREGRIQARQSGATWLTTIAAVKRAIKEGKLRIPE